MRYLVASILLAAVAVIHPSTADACQLSEPISPLNNLYGASSVIYGEVVTTTTAGYLVRRLDSISGTQTADVTLPFSDCQTLTVGDYLALAIPPGPTRISYVTYPVVKWPLEPENQALITAFAKATTDVAIAKVLAAHVRLGWSSYVDFPMIALFLVRTPAVVNELSPRTAREMLRDLSRHPRAKANAQKALAGRAR